MDHKGSISSLQEPRPKERRRTNLQKKFLSDEHNLPPIAYGYCHGKPTMDGVKFINFSCLKIEQNHTSSCSLPVITYESILGFSYTSSFFMQIRLKKVLLAVLLLKNLAKYNKEINMTVKFLLMTFKQSCVIICCQEILKFLVFFKNLYKYHFWLDGLLEK